MILCVNLNAAIDKIVTVDHFSLDAIHRPQKVIAQPGGKGINVARVIQTLGEPPIVTGFVGGYAGQFINAGLKQEGISTSFIRVPSESRTCLSILDPTQNTLTEIYERGEPIPVAAIKKFKTNYRKLLMRCSLVVLSGSLPPNVPKTFYADLIRIARQANVPTWLDSSGDPLQLGLAARPSLVKPNRHEVEVLIRSKPDSIEQFAHAAHTLAKKWRTTFVLSLGVDGAIAANATQVWRVESPHIHAISSVGSGDAMLAGMAIGWIRKNDFEEMLCLGAAAGAANALCLGAGLLRKSAVRKLFKQVKIFRLE